MEIYVTLYYKYMTLMKHDKIKKFTIDAKRIDLKDDSLVKTILEFSQMNNEQQQKFSLGANLYKLRLALKEGRGKSG